MLVNVKYDRSTGWDVDHSVIRLIPELQTVLDDEKLGAKAIAFIALSFDPDSLYVKTLVDEDNRVKEVYKSTHKDAGLAALLKNKKVKEATERYKDLSEPPVIKLRNQYQQGVMKVGKFIEDEQDNINKDNFSDFVANLTKLPQLITGYSQMDEDKSNDVEQVKGVVTGNRTLSYAELKKKQKLKKK